MKHTKDKGRAPPRGRRRLEFGAPKQQLPLLNKAVYMDMKNSRQADLMEEQLKKLGARVEKFLSVEVNYVISSSGPSKPDEKLIREENPQSPSFVPSPFNCVPSPSVQPEAKTVVVSRGKALAQIACAKNKASSVVTSAEKLGIKVVSAEAATKWLEKEIKKMKRGIESNVKENKSKKTEAKLKESKTKCKLLTGSFIKFEDNSRHYRPVKVELDRWPRLNLTAPPGICPFGEAKIKVQNLYGARIPLPETSHIACGEAVPIAPSQAAPTPAEEEARQDQTPAAQSELVGVPIGTTGDAKRILNFHFKKNLAINKQQGFCECCGIKFHNLDEHLKGEEHRSFARQKSNYESLDALISQSPSTIDFLQSVLLKHCVQRREEPTVSSCASTEYVNLVPPISPLTTEKTNVPSQETAATCLKTPDPSGQEIVTFKEHLTATDMDLVSKRDTTPTKKEPAVDNRPQAVVIRRPMPSGMFTSPRRRPTTPSKKPWMQERSMVFSDSPIGSLQPSPCTTKEALPMFFSDNTVKSLNRLVNVCDTTDVGKPNLTSEGSKVTKNVFSILLNQNFSKFRKKKNVTAKPDKKGTGVCKTKNVTVDQEEEVKDCHLDTSMTDIERGNVKNSHDENTTTEEDKEAEVFHHGQCDSVEQEAAIKHNQIWQSVAVDKENEVNNCCDEKMMTVEQKSKLNDFHSEECITLKKEVNISHHTNNVAANEENQMKDSNNKSLAVEEEMECTTFIHEKYMTVEQNREKSACNQETDMTARQEPENIDSNHDTGMFVEQEMEATSCNNAKFVIADQEMEKTVSGHEASITVEQEKELTSFTHDRVVSVEEEMEKTASDHETVMTVEQEKEVTGVNYDTFVPVEEVMGKTTSGHEAVMTVNEENEMTGSNQEKPVAFEQVMEVTWSSHANGNIIEQESEVTGFSHDIGITVEQVKEVPKFSRGSCNIIEQESEVTGFSHDIGSTVEQVKEVPRFSRGSCNIIEQESEVTGFSHDNAVIVEQGKEVTGFSHDNAIIVEQEKEVPGFSHDNAIIVEQEKEVPGFSHDNAIIVEQEKEVTGFSHDNDITFEQEMEVTLSSHNNYITIKQENERNDCYDDKTLTVGNEMSVTDVHCWESIAVKKNKVIVSNNENSIPNEHRMKKKGSSHKKGVVFEEEKKSVHSNNEKNEAFVDNKDNTANDANHEESVVFEQEKEQVYCSDDKNISVEQEMEEIGSNDDKRSTVIHKNEVTESTCDKVRTIEQNMEDKCSSHENIVIIEEEMEDTSSNHDKMVAAEEMEETRSDHEQMAAEEMEETRSDHEQMAAEEMEETRSDHEQMAAEKEATTSNHEKMGHAEEEKEETCPKHEQLGDVGQEIKETSLNHEKVEIVEQEKEETSLNHVKQMTVFEQDKDKVGSKLNKSLTVEQEEVVTNSSHEERRVVEQEKEQTSFNRENSVFIENVDTMTEFHNDVKFPNDNRCKTVENKETQRSDHEQILTDEQRNKRKDFSHEKSTVEERMKMKVSNCEEEKSVKRRKHSKHDKSISFEEKERKDSYCKEDTDVEKRKERKRSNHGKHVAAEEKNTTKDCNHEKHITVENNKEKESSDREKGLTDEQRSKKIGSSHGKIIDAKENKKVKVSNREEEKSVERRKERKRSNHGKSISTEQQEMKDSNCKEGISSVEKKKDMKRPNHEKHLAVEEKKITKDSNYERSLSVQEKEMKDSKEGTAVEKRKERKRSNHEKHVAVEEKKDTKDSNHIERETVENKKEKKSSVHEKGLTDEQRDKKKSSNCEKDKSVERKKKRKHCNHEKHKSVEEKEMKDSNCKVDMDVEKRKERKRSNHEKDVAAEEIKNTTDSNHDECITVENKEKQRSDHEKRLTDDQRNKKKESSHEKSTGVEEKKKTKVSNHEEKSVEIRQERKTSNPEKGISVEVKERKDSKCKEDMDVEKRKERKRSNHGKHVAAEEKKNTKDSNHDERKTVENKKENESSDRDEQRSKKTYSSHEKSVAAEENRKVKVSTREEEKSVERRKERKCSNHKKSIPVEEKERKDSKEGMVVEIEKERKRSNHEKHVAGEEMKDISDSNHGERITVENKEKENSDRENRLTDEQRRKKTGSSHGQIIAAKENKKMKSSNHEEEKSVERRKERKCSNHGKKISVEEQEMKDSNCKEGILSVENRKDMKRSNHEQHLAVEEKNTKDSNHERSLSVQEKEMKDSKEGTAVEKRKERKRSNHEKHFAVEEKKDTKDSNHNELETVENKKEKKSSVHEKGLTDEQRDKKKSSNCEKDKSVERKKERKRSNHEKKKSVEEKEMKDSNCKEDMDVEKRKERKRSNHEKCVTTEEKKNFKDSNHDECMTIENKKEKERFYEKRFTDEQRSEKTGSSHEKSVDVEEKKKKVSNSKDKSVERRKERKRSNHEKSIFDEEKKMTDSKCKEDMAIGKRKEMKKSNEKHLSAEEKNNKKDSSHEKSISVVEREIKGFHCKEDMTLQKKEMKRSNNEKHVDVVETNNKKSSDECAEHVAVEKVKKGSSQEKGRNIQPELKIKNSDNNCLDIGQETPRRNMNPVVRISGKELRQCIVYKNLPGKGLGAEACKLIYVASHKDNINNLLLKEGQISGQTSEHVDSCPAHAPADTAYQGLIKNKGEKGNPRKSEDKSCNNKKTCSKICNDVDRVRGGNTVLNMKNNTANRHTHLDKTMNVVASNGEESDKVICGDSQGCHSNVYRGSSLKEELDVGKTKMRKSSAKDVSNFHGCMKESLEKQGKEFVADKKDCDVKKYVKADRQVGLEETGQVTEKVNRVNSVLSNMKFPNPNMKLQSDVLRTFSMPAEVGYMDEDTVDSYFYERYKGNKPNKIVNTDELNNVHTSFSHITKLMSFPHITEPASFPHITEPASFSHIREPASFSHIREPTFFSHMEPASFSHITEPASFPHITEPASFSHIREPTSFPHIMKPASFSHIREPTFFSHMEPAYFSHITEPTSFPHITEPASFSHIRESIESEISVKTCKANSSDSKLTHDQSMNRQKSNTDSDKLVRDNELGICTNHRQSSSYKNSTTHRGTHSQSHSEIVMQDSLKLNIQQRNVVKENRISEDNISVDIEMVNLLSRNKLREEHTEMVAASVSSSPITTCVVVVAASDEVSSSSINSCAVAATASDEVSSSPITSCAVVVDKQSKHHLRAGGSVSKNGDTESLLSSENMKTAKENSDEGSDFIELLGQLENVVVVPNIADRVKSRSRVACTVGQGIQVSDEEKKAQRRRKKALREKHKKKTLVGINSQQDQQLSDISGDITARNVMTNSGDKCHKDIRTEKSTCALIVPNIAESVKKRRSCTLFNHPGQYANSGEGSDGEDENMKVISMSDQKSRQRYYSSRERNLKALSLKSGVEYDKNGLVKHLRFVHCQKMSSDVKLESSIDMLSEMETEGKISSLSGCLSKAEDGSSDLSSAVVIRRNKSHVYASSKRPEVDWTKVQHSEGSSEQDNVESSLLRDILPVAENNKTIVQSDLIPRSSPHGWSHSIIGVQARRAELTKEAKVILVDINTSPYTDIHTKASSSHYHANIHTTPTKPYHRNIYTNSPINPDHANIPTNSPTIHYPTNIHIKTPTSPYTNIPTKTATNQYHSDNEDLVVHKSRYRKTRRLVTCNHTPCSKHSSSGISCSPRLRLKIRRRSGNKGFSSTLEEIHDCASVNTIGSSVPVNTEHCSSQCEGGDRFEEKFSSRIHHNYPTEPLTQHHCMSRSSSPDVLDLIPQAQYEDLIQALPDVIKSSKRKREPSTSYSSDSERTLEYPLDFEAINKRIKLSPGDCTNPNIDGNYRSDNQYDHNEISAWITACATSINTTLSRDHKIGPASSNRLRSSSPCFSSPVTKRYFQCLTTAKKSDSPGRSAVGSQSPVFNLSRKQLRHMQSSHSAPAVRLSEDSGTQMNNDSSCLALKNAGLEANVMHDSSLPLKRAAGRHHCVKRLLSPPHLVFPSAKKTKVDNSWGLVANRSSEQLLESKQEAISLEDFPETSDHGVHSLFQEYKFNPASDFKHSVNHVLPSYLTSTSEYGESSVLPFAGALPLDMKNFDSAGWGAGTAKDISVRNANPNGSDEDTVMLLDIDSLSGVSELGFENLLNQVHTFSSPDKATDMSWGAICDTYLSTSFNNHNIQTSRLPVPSKSPAGREARGISFSPCRKQFKTCSSPFIKRTAEVSVTGQSVSIHEDFHKQKTTVGPPFGERTMCKDEANCTGLDSVQQELRTPVKSAGIEDLDLSPYIQQVDEVISFNFMSPQRVNPSPHRSATKALLSPQAEHQRPHTASHSRRLFSPAKVSPQGVNSSPHQTHRSSMQSLLSPPAVHRRPHTASHSKRLFSPAKMSAPDKVS